MTARVLRDVPDRTYHRDEVEPGAPPTLSRSCAWTLLTESPLHAYMFHPRLGGLSRKSTKAMDTGQLVHCLLLGQGPNVVVVRGFDDWRKDAARAQKKELLATGALPILQKDLDEAEEIVAQVTPRLPFDLQSGITEATILWEEFCGEGAPSDAADTHTPCRARLDHYEAGVISDIKCREELNVKGFKRELEFNSHGIQPGIYVRGVEAAFPDLAGLVKFQYVLLELSPPFCVVVIEVEGDRLMVGDRVWNHVVPRWADCLSSGVWPGPASEVVREVPTWEAMRWMSTMQGGGGEELDDDAKAAKFEGFFSED